MCASPGQTPQNNSKSNRSSCNDELSCESYEEFKNNLNWSRFYDDPDLTLGFSTDDNFFKKRNKHIGTERHQRLSGGGDGNLSTRDIDLRHGAKDKKKRNGVIPDCSAVHDFSKALLSSTQNLGTLNEMLEINSTQGFISATHLMLDDESEPSYDSSESAVSLQSSIQQYLVNESPPFLSSSTTSWKEMTQYHNAPQISPNQSYLTNESPPSFVSSDTSPERSCQTIESHGQQLVNACEALIGSPPQRHESSRYDITDATNEPIYVEARKLIEECNVVIKQYRERQQKQKQQQQKQQQPQQQPQQKPQQQPKQQTSLQQQPNTSSNHAAIAQCSPGLACKAPYPPTPPTAYAQRQQKNTDPNCTFTGNPAGYQLPASRNLFGTSYPNQSQCQTPPRGFAPMPSPASQPITPWNSTGPPQYLSNTPVAGTPSANNSFAIPQTSSWCPQYSPWATGAPASVSPAQPRTPYSPNCPPSTDQRCQSAQQSNVRHVANATFTQATSQATPQANKTSSQQAACKTQQSNQTSDSRRTSVQEESSSRQSQSNKLTMQGECRSSMKQKLLFESLVRDQYAPGAIQATLDGKIDFNKTSFDLHFGVDVPKCQPEVEPLSLLEAFYLRIAYEREQMFGCRLETVDIETHFAKQLQTDLNKSIASLFTAEKLEAEKNSKGVEFEADIKSAIITLQGSNLSGCDPILLSNFTGSTKSKGGTEKPADEKPAGEKPAGEKPAEEKPAAEKPAEETAGDKPAAEKPAEEKPAEEKPAAETPAAEKPAAETPAAETPAAEAEKPAA